MNESSGGLFLLPTYIHAPLHLFLFSLNPFYRLSISLSSTATVAVLHWVGRQTVCRAYTVKKQYYKILNFLKIGYGSERVKVFQTSSDDRNYTLKRKLCTCFCAFSMEKGLIVVKIVYESKWLRTI